MSDVIEVQVPDIGGFADVPVIDVLVRPGESVCKEQPIVTLESEKATMDVPAPNDGVVGEIRVKVGDKVSQGSALLTLSGANGKAEAPKPEQAVVPASAPPAAAPATRTTSVELRVPDVGDFHDIPIIEILIKAGDRIEKEAPLITMESEKASLEVPSAAAGTVESVAVKVGDKVSQGALIAVLRTESAAPAQMATPPAAAAALAPTQASAASPPLAPTAPAPVAHTAATPASEGALVHASPSIRRLAREFGVDLGAVRGTAPNGRITREDVQNFVKSTLHGAPAAPPGGAGLGLAPWPKVDFEKFGPIERQQLSRIKKISGAALHRNWVMIPHVTNNDEADVTQLEAFRQALNAEQGKAGVKVTMLAFLIKACVAALQHFPAFNASLDGDALVLKKYYHIGFAADTPQGLMVPVIKDADKKGVLAIAKASSELAEKARDGKLGMGDIQGGTFTISSLGGIGGTSFSPIINAPEVAILGVSRSALKPVWDGKAFEPRLMLPLSLSYDHRVIDGAAAARFNVFLGNLLADMRRTLL